MKLIVILALCLLLATSANGAGLRYRGSVREARHYTSAVAKEQKGASPTSLLEESTQTQSKVAGKAQDDDDTGSDDSGGDNGASDDSSSDNSGEDFIEQRAEARRVDDSQPAVLTTTTVSSGTPLASTFVPAIVTPPPQLFSMPPLTAVSQLGLPGTPLPTPYQVQAEQAAVDRDPAMVRLNQALEAIRQDILSTNKQIADERKWVAAVGKITSSYEIKMKRVEEHVVELRREMARLYQKKKQLENLKLQHALQGKLKEANDELALLQNSLQHVQLKSTELNKSHKELTSTISSIEQQLSKLRGTPANPTTPAAAASLAASAQLTSSSAAALSLGLLQEAQELGRAHGVEDPTATTA
jgi:hypothetical protein